MAEDGKIGSIPTLDFGALIAFVLPGFVAVFSLSYVSVWVKAMFESLLSKDTSAGAAFIITLASLATGMIVSSTRSLILDSLRCKMVRPAGSWLPRFKCKWAIFSRDVPSKAEPLN